MREYLSKTFNLHEKDEMAEPIRSANSAFAQQYPDLNLRKI